MTGMLARTRGSLDSSHAHLSGETQRADRVRVRGLAAVHRDRGSLRRETLPQLAAHFYQQSLEERNHAMMMVQYLLDSGDEVIIPAVAAPQTSFADDVAPVALALDQEKRVTAQISAARRHGARGRRSRRRAVHALVPAGAARGGLVDVGAPPGGGAAARTTSCSSRTTSRASPAARTRSRPVRRPLRVGRSRRTVVELKRPNRAAEPARRYHAARERRRRRASAAPRCSSTSRTRPRA